MCVSHTPPPAPGGETIVWHRLIWMSPSSFFRLLFFFCKRTVPAFDSFVGRVFKGLIFFFGGKILVSVFGSDFDAVSARSSSDEERRKKETKKKEKRNGGGGGDDGGGGASRKGQRDADESSSRPPPLGKCVWRVHQSALKYNKK